MRAGGRGLGLWANMVNTWLWIQETPVPHRYFFYSTINSYLFIWITYTSSNAKSYQVGQGISYIVVNFFLLFHGGRKDPILKIATYIKKQVLQLRITVKSSWLWSNRDVTGIAKIYMCVCVYICISIYLRYCTSIFSHPIRAILIRGQRIHTKKHDTKHKPSPPETKPGLGAISIFTRLCGYFRVTTCSNIPKFSKSKEGFGLMWWTWAVDLLPTLTQKVNYLDNTPLIWLWPICN